MKIYNMKEIETLYKEGKISRTTWWRGRKRGWIDYGYHQPRDNGAIYNKKEMEVIYRYIFKVALYVFNIYKKNKYLHDKEIVQDMAHDGFLYIVERKIPFNEIKKHMKYLFFNLYIKKPVWAKYVDIPTTHKNSEIREVSFQEN